MWLVEVTVLNRVVSAGFIVKEMFYEMLSGPEGI